MSRPKTTILDKLSAAQLTIDNSRTDEEIQSLVSAFGYSAERLTEGCELAERARAAVQAQILATGAQREATQAELEARKAAIDAYQSLAKVVRAACPPAQRIGLGLGGNMPTSTGRLLETAYALFDNAVTLTSLASFGYTPEKLAAERARIAAYDEANRKQEAAKGAAQQATREQDTALQALNEWTAQYLKIAKVALREKPQLLEKLGIAARTAPTAAQRLARRKVRPTGSPWPIGSPHSPIPSHRLPQRTSPLRKSL